MSRRARNRTKNRGKNKKKPSDIWLKDEDAQLEHRVAHRQTRPGDLPDAGDLVAMGLLVDRVLHASVLLQDMTGAMTDLEAPLRPAGLTYVVNALNRDATRLFRLYHGKPPSDV